MQGTVSGLKRGLGYGLGAVLGGVLYSSLGPRMCFAVSAALPCLALLLLTVLPRTCVREGGRRDDGGGDELDGWELEISKGDASVSTGNPFFGHRDVRRVPSAPKSAGLIGRVQKTKDKRFQPRQDDQ